jgi:hypothetical protein
MGTDHKYATASEVFDQAGFINDIEDAMEHIITNPSEYEAGDNDRYEYYLLDISSGAAGTYQPSEICGLFGVPPEAVLTEEEIEELDASGDWNPDEAIRNAEFVWEFIDDDLIPPVEDELNQWLSEAGLPGRVYFGHLEGDGSYGLFYAMDDIEVEDYVDGVDNGIDDRGLTARDRRQNQRFMRDQPGLPYDEE